VIGDRGGSWLASIDPAAAPDGAAAS